MNAEFTAKSIQDEYRERMLQDMDACREDALRMREWLDHSSTVYHEKKVFTLQIPKIFTKTDTGRFEQIVTTTYGILTKVIRHYLTNPAYRSLFPFSRELEELILVPNLYNSVLPIARFDIFYNEETGDFRFCEINTDGTSAMNEDMVLNQAAGISRVHRDMQEKYRLSSYELFDSWIRRLMEIYSSYEKKVAHPHVAIVDELETCSITEFEEFQRHFEAAGISCELCEVTKLTYHDGRLYSPTGKEIHIVYRRLVTTDAMRLYDKIPAFLQAVKDQNVCVIGSFCTQIAHNKWLFKALHEKETAALLTEEENAFVRRHIPYTDLLNDSCCDYAELLKNKDRWLIKPMDSYASQGVFAGCDQTPEEWTALIERHKNTVYIYQEYCPPYRTMNIAPELGETEFQPYTNMTGLFVYNGHFAGCYSRLSTGGIISSQYNERSVATLVACPDVFESL